MKTNHRILVLTAACLLGLLGVVAPLSAQTLLLNFGSSNALTSGGVAAGNNPAGVGVAATDWNTITGDYSAGSLLYSTGAVASTVTVDLGSVSSSGGNPVLKLSATTFTNLAAGTGSGIFANGTPGSNSLYSGVSGGGIGAVVGGLAAGTYTIYVGAVRASAATANELVYGGSILAADAPAANTSTNFTLNSANAGWNYAAQGVAQTNGSFSTWSNGVDYTSFQVTLNSGDDLFVATGIAGTSPLSFIEIVPSAVSEPKIWTGLAMGAGLLFFAARRRARGLSRAA